MRKLTSGPKRCKCGYAVYMTLSYTEMPRFYGCEPDELNGVEILRWCPQCEAKLAVEDLLGESEYQSKMAQDDYEVPVRCERIIELCGYEDVKDQVESVHWGGDCAATDARANAGDVLSVSCGAPSHRQVYHESRHVVSNGEIIGWKTD